MALRVSVVGTCWPHAVQDLFVKRLPSNETAIGVDRFMHEEVRINVANEQDDRNKPEGRGRFYKRPRLC